MNIENNLENGTLTVKLTGRLDTITSPDLDQALDFSSIDRLVFEISGLEYVSSAGLRVFLSAHKQMAKKGGMVIVGSQPSVKEVFDITGFSDIFDLK